MIPLVVALLALAPPGPGQDPLDRFRKAYKGNEEERAAAVAQLAGAKDRKVLEVLARVLEDPSPSVRIEAVNVLSAWEKDAEAAQIVSKAIPASKKWPDVQVACLDALGKIRDWGSNAAILDTFDSPEFRVVGAALKAAGKVRNPASVEPLIKFLRNTGAGTGRPGSWMEHQVNRALAVLAAQGALQQITGESRRRRPERASDTYRAPRDADGWEAWWREHGTEVTARLKKEEQEELERLGKPSR
jgi:hypothetical protein